jgi:hypothetical protein
MEDRIVQYLSAYQIKILITKYNIVLSINLSLKKNIFLKLIQNVELLQSQDENLILMRFDLFNIEVL